MGRERLRDRLHQRITALASRTGWRLGVAIHDLASGEQLVLNETEQFPAASLAKIPIMVEVFRQAHEGRLKLDTWVEVGAADQVEGAGVIHALSPGARFRVADLLSLMITVSDNTAANMLLDLVGMDAVNATAWELGLRGTRICNKFQVIPVVRTGNNVTTARDMTVLLTRIVRGEAVSWDACRRMLGLLKRQQFNEGLPSRLPVAGEGPVGSIPLWEVAHKTGMLSDAFHDAGLVYLPGRGFAITVLTSGSSNRAAASAVVGCICRWYFDYCNSAMASGAG